jgi:RNA-directed DNA polymerase
MDKAKPFKISRWEVWEAYKEVKANRGAGGVDRQTIVDFERDLKDNLYKLWNRMSSGSYFPPPVRRVDIPKGKGKTRPLGIPTVSDRIAQAVVKRYLEPKVEPRFHPDSYGYRPGKSAIDAVGRTRERCWRYDWVLDLDIKGFFDSIDHDLMMRAVKKHTDTPWVLLYIERWLKAPAQMQDGTLVNRERGTPQGGVISPLLANLFLHYAFDMWMKRKHPHIPFERYADDIVCHCRTEEQAEKLRSELEHRLAACGLDLHPEKTRIVYCKDDDRGGNYPNEKFESRWGKFFVSFSPAVSTKAANKLRDKLRSWHLYRRSDLSLDDLAQRLNPVIRGWTNYFRHFRKSAMEPVLRQVDMILVRWAAKKFNHLRGYRKRTFQWLQGIARRQPRLFVHWSFLWVRAGL